MSTKVRTINWSPDEWLAGTSMLSAVEIAVYVTVINLIYSHGEPVANDPAWVGRNCGLHTRSTRVALRRLIELGKIQVLPPVQASNGSTFIGGKLTNRRCEQELKRAGHRMRVSISAAERSANARRTRRLF